MKPEKAERKNYWNYLYLVVVIVLGLTIGGLYLFMITFS
jgi:hypothetical protein